jgi:hypothetical protein
MERGGETMPPQAKEYRSFRPIGFAELEVVKQEIQRYEAGEVAHIENVLQGEYKERTHRELERAEETYLEETEKTEESEKDLQSTERFELQKETQETVKQDSSLEAGVNATARYGSLNSFVEVKGDLKYQTKNASEKATRSATTYARDVTERSVSRIQERVHEQRITTTITEFEEKNFHRVSNEAGTDHVVGIYRWVDKWYKAQVYNYGWRLMFEFIVPEPAAFTRYVSDKKTPEGVTMKEPKEPSLGPKELVYDWQKGVWAYRDVGEQPLRPHHITWYNYQQWVAQYKVVDVDPLPPSHCSLAKTFVSKREYDNLQTFWEERKKDWEAGKESEVGNAQWVRPAYETQNAEITIPDEYRATQAVANVYLAPYIVSAQEDGSWAAFGRWCRTNDEFVAISIGRETRYLDGGGHIKLSLNLDKETQSLPVTVQATYRSTWMVSLEIMCELTEDALAKWQQKTYDAIVTAYLNLKSEYEEQLAAAAIQEGIAISGRNTELNRELEKTELKKGALTLLTQESRPHLAGVGSIRPYQELYPDFINTELEVDIITGGSMTFQEYQDLHPDATGLGEVAEYPDIDFNKIEAQALEIQFLEQAFEWTHMMYTFYPYFWARKELWPTLQQLDDTDPLHAQFLQAGAARVLIPVRPGYEESIMSYINTGKLPEKDEFDTMAKLYLAIVDEVREKQDADFARGMGTISVTNKTDVVNGTDTKFGENDEGREIIIRGETYHVKSVESETQLTLTEPYRGKTEVGTPYNVLAKAVGKPWYYKVPTSLVYLQQDKVKLPDFTG